MRTKKSGLSLFVGGIKLSGEFFSFYISIKVDNIWILLCIKLIHLNVFEQNSAFWATVLSDILRCFRKIHMICLQTAIILSVTLKLVCSYDGIRVWPSFPTGYG